MTSVAYFNGRFVDVSEVVIPASDAGFLLGTTVAEQLRTFNGRPFWIAQHLQRMALGLSLAGIKPPIERATLSDVVMSIVDQNIPLLVSGREGIRSDMGVTIFCTPGAYPAYGVASNGPILAVHAYPLQFRNWANRYRSGQPAVISSHREIPPECWPPEIKCRSRMHYHLASREAKAIDPDAVPILLDTDGNVAETPIASIIGFRESDGFVAPSEQKTLPGISLGYIRQWAARSGISFCHRDIPASELFEFDELLLTSTPFATIPVVSVNGRSIGNGTLGNMYRRLIAEWSSDVGVDIVLQAQRFAGS